MKNEKWYFSNWFVILMLIILFPVGLILMWVSKKWNNKTRWFVTGAIIVLVIVANFSDSEDEQSEEPTKQSVEKKEKPKEKSTPKKKEKEKPKEKEKKKESIKHNKQDGYDVYERDGGMPFSENSSIKHFSMEMSNKLKKDHKKIDNGAIFKDVMEFEDKKGNEEKIVAIVAYVSKETIDDINFDNWPNNPESLYDVSDGVVFHYYINDNKIAETRNQDEIPQQFYDMLGENK